MEIRLPPLPETLQYTGEWRSPKYLELYLSIIGDPSINYADDGMIGSHHILSGPNAWRPKLLAKLKLETEARHFRPGREHYKQELLKEIQLATEKCKLNA